MGYKVRLDVFEGPFDLLVYLIESARMNIYDIRVSEICKKYGLNTPVFVNISCKISYYYMVTSPITIRQTTSYDHELLIKNGTR